jgi:ribosomal protein S18 acetylase RimI-like enzyme
MTESLGFRTDLMVLSLQGSSIEARDGYRVIRSPRNPAYHWGNFILLDEPPARGTVTDWLRVFAREFPDAGHLTLGVDGTKGSAGDGAELSAGGLEVERDSILTASELRPSAHPKPAADIRMFEPEDWAAAAKLEQLIFPSDEPDFEPFLRAKFETMRESQESGQGGWFGAFVDGQLVAALGLFDDGGGVARYHSIETHPDFRGRGLASALIRFAAEEAFARRGVTRLVIAADPDDSPIRLYRSLGFADTEIQIKLERASTERSGG